MKKHKTLKIVLIIVVCLAIYFVIRNLQLNSVSYQMKKLESGNSEQKVMASIFMGENKINEAIPLLVSYIDSDEWFLYKGKGGWYLSCTSSKALGEITGNNFGNTCNTNNSKTEEQINQTKQDWRDWYDNK